MKRAAIVFSVLFSLAAAGGDAETEYARRAAAAKSADDHFQLALWCADRGLPAYALRHHRAVVTLAPEHYNRLHRLASRGIPPRVEIEVRNALDNSDTREYNVLGEWRGSDLADQLVMIGGHFDSWHMATGATDDAAGCAVLLEAIRILKAIGVTPRRTIRVALWSWEEGGVNGSRAYVRNHAELRDKLAAYFNLDNGSGRIRGIYLQGNERVRPIFSSWLAPFADLEATTITAENAFGVDAIAFDMAAIAAAESPVAA